MQRGNTVRQIPRNIPKKKETLKVFIVKSAFLSKMNPAFLALGWSRMVISQMPGYQGDECQVV